MVLDSDQTDGLGLPLARGPFATLDDAKVAMSDARTGTPPEPPKFTLVHSADRQPKAGAGAKPGRAAPDRPVRPTPTAVPRSSSTRAPAARKAPTQIVIRELRGTDGESLRKLWKEAGLSSLGDDDRSLARMARRNPGLVLVAVEGTQIVASALAGWDGRRGWIYHVATAASHRRQGIATRLLDQIEAALAVLGALKVNAMVQPDNDDGRAFWEARGYTPGQSRQVGKEL
jgi:ribosomal protein S18 acetylase RimI-like enzyme